MAADGPVMQGAKTPEAFVLTKFSQNLSASTPELLNRIDYLPGQCCNLGVFQWLFNIPVPSFANIPLWIFPVIKL